MRAACLAALLMLPSCSRPPDGTEDPSRDLHSYANAAEARATHLDLDLEVDFEARQLRGTCTLDVVGPGTDLVLDTRDIDVERVEVSERGEPFRDTAFEVGSRDPILGAPLRVARGTAARVRVTYATRERASGLQWLAPTQTADGRYPFLYSQSQAIHARSWIPLQDSPGIRVTYTARIRAPTNLLAVMSAEALSGDGRGGDYRFRMPLAIPPYLIALAVGDLAFEATGERTGVYAERSVLEAAVREFADTEAMMQAAEALYGPYRWGRYDILVLPPAFPFGGMENPRLTFLSPTVIAGDRSLVNIVAHELAHSWSGNLTTNATWRDFWLNEGFTVYFEERILEAVYGPDRAAMESALEVAQLKVEMAGLDERDQVLHVNLAGRDPEDGLTDVPYIKGAMFLRTVEKAVGRDEFDPFLRSYFDKHAFRSVTTPEFERYLRTELLAKHPVAAAIPVKEWLGAPGLPESRHEPASAALDQADASAREWLDGAAPAARLRTADWTTQHWLRFLRALPETLETARLDELDAAFGLTEAGNAEILTEWLVLCVRSGYGPAEAALERFLRSVGRMKFLRPLYNELAKTDGGRRRAEEIYLEARPGYHPMAAGLVDSILESDESPDP